MKIAVPILANSMDGALRDMDRASLVADIIELRIDYMPKSNLERLLGHTNLPIIVTNRPMREGGRFEGNEQDRLAYLQEAIHLKAAYVDIEANSYYPLVRRESTQMIVSYHNFLNTPADLDAIYQRVARYGPDITKIATMAKSYDDSQRMLDLISSASAKGKIIGVCMGDKGAITRIEGPLKGGYLTFASLDKTNSLGEGQLTVAELRRAWEFMSLPNRLA